MTRNKLLGLAAVVVLAGFSSGCSDSLLQAVREDVERATNTEAPTGSISINSGAGYTQSANVTLSLSAVDAAGTVDFMEVRNDAAFTGNWQAYAASLAWSLSSGDGTKTVYVRYRDDSENISATYTDTIVLDTVDPTVSSRTPASGALNQLRAVNAVVNFSENMDQSTFTTSTVYLQIKNGTTVATSMSKTATNVTLNPVSNLYYGYDYTIVVTSGVKDLSGRAVSNPGSTDFTVERDFWEGANGNDLPTNAFDVTGNSAHGPVGGSLPWTDLVPDTQDEDDAGVIPVNQVHTPLAVLEGVDYYTIEVPLDVYKLHIRVLFTTDTTHGTTVDTSGTESLRLSVNHNGTTNHGMGGFLAANTDLPYDRDFEFDVTSDPDFGESDPETYTIMIYENSSNYTNRRTYNLRWYFVPGI